MPVDQAIASLDPWVASSLLQKAIRRSDMGHAVHAALRLHRLRGNGIWRRLMIIAVEDVGIGDLDLVAEVALLGTDANARREKGTDPELIVDLVQRLAVAPKDRSTDYLICTAIRHPAFEVDRDCIALLPDEARVAVAIDPNQPVIRRAIATWYASGINGGGPQIVGPGDLPLLLRKFRGSGVPAPIVMGIELAARKTKEPIAIMLLLLAALQLNTDQPNSDDWREMPVTGFVDGIPLYAFDKHTALGKRAIAQFATQNATVETVVSEYVADFRARGVVEMACFYADAVPVLRRVAWSLSEELEALGVEVDMMKVGCPKEGVTPILSTVRDNLDHLNLIRSRGLNARKRPAHAEFEIEEAR